MEKLEVVVFGWTEEWDGWEVMYINGVESLNVHGLSECPEDAIIGRDLVDCTDVASFMKQASGKEVIYKYVEGNPEEMDEELFRNHLKFN